MPQMANKGFWRFEVTLCKETELSPSFKVAETICLVIQIAQKTVQYLDLTSNTQGPEVCHLPSQADFVPFCLLKTKNNNKNTTKKNKTQTKTVGNGITTQK